MPSTVQLNTRIDPALKRAGDVVFARAGLTSSQVVRRVWEAAARTQEVPACVLGEEDSNNDRSSSAVRDGRGVARRVMEQRGIVFADAPYDYRSLRDDYLNDLLDHSYAQIA